MAATAFAFRSPVAIIAIASARSIVPIPIDSASLGTRVTAPPKAPAFSARVESSSVTLWVRALSTSPGSLNPMWPFTPIPSSNRPNPPHAAIVSSYRSHSTSGSATMPFRLCVRAGSRLTPDRRCSVRKRRKLPEDDASRPTNSSSRNAVAREKSASPSEWRRRSSVYASIGVRPAGKPRTRSGVRRNASATRRATARLASVAVSKIVTSNGVRSAIGRECQGSVCSGQCQRHSTVRRFCFQSLDLAARGNFSHPFTYIRG